MNIRPAEVKDAQYCFQLRTEPLTQQYSNHRIREDFDTYRQWFVQELPGHVRRFYIAEVDGYPVGMGNLTLYEDEIELSIVIAPNYRNQGYAKQLIDLLTKAALKITPKRPITAYIKTGNLASMKAFADRDFYNRGMVARFVYAPVE